MSMPQSELVSGPNVNEEPDWYKDAIIYEVHVRAFSDSNADGIGDFRGLTSRLDYLRDLGITAIWLLPFSPSPLRDDGYDIANYTDINPMYGTLDDFKAFVAAAHARGLKVITELVINHTSDQHPWFQRARHAPPDSPERNFYVWSDTPDRYSDARIIFTDTERSNWTWDSVANAYYWHRFFSHQPDLNFDNPQVQTAVLGLLEFWFDLGVDGYALMLCPTCMSVKGRTARTCRKRMPFSSGYGPTLMRGMKTVCCSPKPTNGPKMPSPTSAMMMSAICRFTFRSCRACLCRCIWKIASRSLTFCAKPRPSPMAASGRCSSATTMNSRSKW